MCAQAYSDGVVYPTLDRTRCLTLLHQHLFQHVVYLRGRYFLQGVGIPQGSILSTLLCNYYYAGMEREHLSGCLPGAASPAVLQPVAALAAAAAGRVTEGGAWPAGSSSSSSASAAGVAAAGHSGGGARGDGEPAAGHGPGAPSATPAHHTLLLRLTDDFLFVSTDRDAAARFGTTLVSGVPEFRCVVNPSKSVCNFPLRVARPGGDVEVPQVPADTGFVPWCGLLFRPETGEVQANFSRCSPRPSRHRVRHGRRVRGIVRALQPAVGRVSMSCPLPLPPPTRKHTYTNARTSGPPHPPIFGACPCANERSSTPFNGRRRTLA